MTKTDEQYDVFISHAGEDKTAAMEICARLEVMGLKCWIAPRNVDSGKSYLEEILHGVKNSKALLLVLSANTQNADYVVNEVERAKSYRKQMFTIRLEDVILPPALELILSAPQWIDAWSLDYDERLTQVVNVLNNQANDITAQIDLSSGTKLLRFIKQNILALITVIILLFFTVNYFFSGQNPPVDPELSTDAYQTVADVRAEDFTVIFSSGISRNKVFLEIQASNPAIMISPKVGNSQFNIRLEFNNGILIEDISSLTRMKLELPKMSTTPDSFQLTISDFDGNSSGPLKFLIPQLGAYLQNQENKINTKEREQFIASLQNVNHSCTMVDGFVSRIQECQLGNMVQPVKLSSAQAHIRSLAIGDSRENLNQLINLDEARISGNLGMVADMDFDKFAILVPVTSEPMFIQVNFIGGETSNIVPLRLTRLSEGSSVVFLKANEDDAPVVMLSKGSFINQGALIVVNDNPKLQIGWDTEITDKPFQRRGNWYIRLLPRLNELADTKEIKITLGDASSLTTYTYKLD